MGDVNWALGLQQNDPGQAFANSFQQGMERRKQMMGQQAMAALVQNPADEKALAALAQVDPQAAMQFKQQAQERERAEHDHWTKVVGNAAKSAQTPEMWDNIVDQFVAAGHPEAAQFKGKFSPAVRAAFMAQAGIADDQHNDGFTLSPGQTRYGPNGQPVASAPGQPRYYPLAPGGKLVLDPSYGGGAPQGQTPQPGQIEDGYRFKGGNPADPSSWEPMNGGPSPGGSGGFL